MSIYAAETTLGVAVNSSVTTVTLASAAGFTAPCYLVIDQEIIYCPSAAVANVFSGVTRGALGTVAAAHLINAGVYGLFSSSYSEAAMGGIGGWWDQIAAELGALETRAAAAAAAFPKTVAVFNANGETGSLTIPLLASPPTGDYAVSVYYVLTVGDVACTLNVDATYADESGAQDINFVADGPGLALGGAGSSLLPLHAVAGTPIELIVTIGAQTTLQYSINVNLVRNQ